MNCPSCGADSKVEETRRGAQGLRRYRRCSRCKLRFTTMEALDLSGHLVRKRDGSTAKFERSKIADSIKKASVRELPPNDLADMVDNVVHMLLTERAPLPDDDAWQAPAPIATRDIADLVMHTLRNDPHYHVVLIRFALLFEPSQGTFDDAETFLKWLVDKRMIAARLDEPLEEPLWVVKRDGTMEPFDRNKLRRSIRVALKKRPRIEDQDRDEKFGDQVMRRLLEGVRFQRLVTSGQLATELLRVLRPTRSGRRLTQLTPKERQLAYLRVASTAKNYTRVEDFVDEARGLIASARPDDATH